MKLLVIHVPLWLVLIILLVSCSICTVVTYRTANRPRQSFWGQENWGPGGPPIIGDEKQGLWRD